MKLKVKIAFYEQYRLKVRLAIELNITQTLRCGNKQVQKGKVKIRMTFDLVRRSHMFHFTFIIMFTCS